MSCSIFCNLRVWEQELCRIHRSSPRQKTDVVIATGGRELSDGVKLSGTEKQSRGLVAPLAQLRADIANFRPGGSDGVAQLPL
jgi:hypothetical protein